jgi:hypothetical protein
MDPVLHAQVLLTHTMLTPHASVQEPQWLGSVEVSTHSWPQITWPCGHTHAPPTQVSPVEHVSLHPPQCFGSVDSLTQSEPAISGEQFV